MLVSVRLLLTQTALLARSHDCEVDGVRAILAKTLQLLESGRASVRDAPRSAQEAVAILHNAVQLSAGKQAHGVKVAQALLSFTCLDAPKLLARLVVTLARIGGADAVKVRVSDRV